MKAVTAKIGLDGHYRGIKFVSRVLRDYGAEVVFLGFHKSASAVAQVAVDEDADLIALSFLSPDYMSHVKDLHEALKAMGGHDIVLILGGLVDPDDHEQLRTLGVDRVFGLETKASDLIDYLDSRTDRPETASTKET